MRTRNWIEILVADFDAVQVVEYHLPGFNFVLYYDPYEEKNFVGWWKEHWLDVEVMEFEWFRQRLLEETLDGIYETYVSHDNPWRSFFYYLTRMDASTHNHDRLVIHNQVRYNDVLEILRGIYIASKL